LKIARLSLLLVLLALSWLPSVTRAEPSSAPKRVLVLYWYDKVYQGQFLWEQSFQASLPGNVEYYPEYLEANRFPGENQSEALHDYLLKKYSARSLDVVVANSEASLNFLLKYRSDLFPRVPLVFYCASRPLPSEIQGQTALTGVVIISSYKRTLELALNLNPEVNQVFVVSGSVEHDKRFEVVAREELREFAGRIKINYLTDLSPPELVARTASLPDRSLVLYAWQQAQDDQGKVLESGEVLSLITKATPVPIYGMSVHSLGRGIIGGHLYTVEAAAGKVAEVVQRITNGERAQDIPVQNVPTVPMFDWRELKRWRINENRLPPGSIVRFKDPTFWEQYKWRIVGALTLIVLQAALITVLLVERRRRQRARLALDHAEEGKRNLAAIVESSNDAILSKTLDGKITTWNAGAERIYGYTTSEIVGRNVSTLAPAERKEEVTRILGQLQRGESVNHLETVRLTRDGRRIEVSLTVSPLKNEHGIIIGASTIARDITRRKRAEMETRRQRNELAHLSRVTMLGELSSSLAHELNQPLGAILRNAEAAELFLQDPSPDLEELRAILGDIRKDDQRAGALIDRMRSMVKRREFEPSLLDLNLLVSEVIGLVGPEVDTRKVQLTFKPASSLSTVSGDRNQLQQVVLNLLLNAMDALNGCELDRRLVDVRIQPSVTLVEVAVSDTGHGIPSDRLAHIFNPFFTTKANGMGMGLAISRTIIEAHGGTIRAENNPDGGAAVYFTVPAAQEERAS
jgi:PAS domain S-box-containing protein